MKAKRIYGGIKPAAMPRTPPIPARASSGGVFRVPWWFPAGWRAGTQVSAPGEGGPSGGVTGSPPILLSQVPRTGPNGNARSNNGSGGFISGFGGYHWPGPPGVVFTGITPSANQYAVANQDMFIPGIMKNPALGS
jgi:hypothetical protein